MSANREMNAAMKGSLSCEDSGMEEYIMKLGPGGVVDGKEVVMQVKPGDKVIYSKYSGTEVKLDEDENLIIVKQSDILAIIE